ncbi:type III secretion system inner rod subunit SctI [Providencia rustigianii]|uniref:type III secretion system inner rod subunit SctI n=1 Tax=Providencia rustigianii TaxID=158850 RepID=UPI0022440A5C|nr:type III secretion system inner rod subunit SctI [Providencia rustigianii]
MLPIISSIAVSNLVDIDALTAPSMPIEEKVKKLFSEYTTSVGQEKADIIEKVNNIDPSNPAKLLELQNQVGNYSLAMNMISTLTHKSVSAIDTVLKAQ